MTSYPIKARIRAEGGVTRVDLMDDIGEDPWFGGGISAAAFTDQLAKVRGPLDVHISSAGGMVDQGLAIYNALAAYPGPVTTYNDGLAASVASVIMQAGSRRVMSPVSALMIHDAWGDPGPGNAADMEAMRDALSKNSDIIARAYADRAGGTVGQWRAAMQKTTWYDADEAKAAGLIDDVAGGSKMPGPVDLEAVAASAPSRIMARLRAAAAPEGDDCPACKGKGKIRDGHLDCPDCKGTGKAPAGDGGAEDRAPRPRAAAPGTETPVCRTCDGRGTVAHPSTGQKTLQCPGCTGTGLYDPDGDGDDDSTAEGDTDHDYVLPDGSPGPAAAALEERVRAIVREELRPVLAQEVKAAALEALRGEAARVDNSAWDGPKAMANGAASDDPAAFYAGICAGEKADGDPATQGHWALPYRYHPDDPPNAAGVKAALSALPKTQALVNEAEAKKTLQAAMKQVNPDYEPEDSTDTIFSFRLEQMRGALPSLLKGADA
jgi:ATP-dependent protease ClpP protease subunit